MGSKCKVDFYNKKLVLDKNNLHEHRQTLSEWKKLFIFLI